jgi:hypothetical protein
MRAVQLGLILFSRERYWRLRTLTNFVIKGFIGHFVIDALITAGVNRSDYFFSPDWLGGEGGVVTSDAAIYRALMLPTGCVSATYDMLAHLVPWRLVVLLQLWTTAVMVRAAWGPVSLLLQSHQKLADDALALCQMASNGLSTLAGLGTASWQPLPKRSSCAGSHALTRTVLATQVRVPAARMPGLRGTGASGEQRNLRRCLHVPPAPEAEFLACWHLPAPAALIEPEPEPHLLHLAPAAALHLLPALPGGCIHSR